MSTPHPLDRIDREILAALQEDGRLSNKELAARVGLAPSTSSERVKRLTTDGVLAGFHARVEPRSLGIGLQAMIMVRLHQHSRELLDGFHDHLLRLREVIGLYHVAGAHDYLVHVAVRDSDHLRDLALGAFTTRSEVAHIETNLIFEHTHAPTLPDYVLVPPCTP